MGACHPTLGLSSRCLSPCTQVRELDRVSELGSRYWEWSSWRFPLVVARWEAAYAIAHNYGFLEDTRSLVTWSADHLRLLREGQLVADHSRGLSDHTCRQLQHTTRLPMKPGHAKWGHRRSQMDDAPVAVQQNHIDREPHGNRMDGLRGNNEQARTGFESWFAQ